METPETRQTLFENEKALFFFFWRWSRAASAAPVCHNKSRLIPRKRKLTKSSENACGQGSCDLSEWSRSHLHTAASGRKRRGFSEEPSCPFVYICAVDFLLLLFLLVQRRRCAEIKPTETDTRRTSSALVQEPKIEGVEMKQCSLL